MSKEWTEVFEKRVGLESKYSIRYGLLFEVICNVTHHLLTTPLGPPHSMESHWFVNPWTVERDRDYQRWTQIKYFTVLFHAYVTLHTSFLTAPLRLQTFATNTEVINHIFVSSIHFSDIPKTATYDSDVAEHNEKNTNSKNDHVPIPSPSVDIPPHIVTPPHMTPPPQPVTPPHTVTSSNSKTDSMTNAFEPKVVKKKKHRTLTKQEKVRKVGFRRVFDLTWGSQGKKERKGRDSNTLWTLYGYLWQEITLKFQS